LSHSQLEREPSSTGMRNAWNVTTPSAVLQAVAFSSETLGTTEMSA
jgi:hypothetical protein